MAEDEVRVVVAATEVAAVGTVTRDTEHASPDIWRCTYLLLTQGYRKFSLTVYSLWRHPNV